MLAGRGVGSGGFGDGVRHWSTKGPKGIFGAWGDVCKETWEGEMRSDVQGDCGSEERVDFVIK
jgi:hypothetical protein